MLNKTNTKKGESIMKKKWAIMGYSLNKPELFNYDSNNLPHSKTLSDLLNDDNYKNEIEDKKIKYLRPIQTSIISENYHNLDFKTKDEVLKWAKDNNRLCNYFAINEIKNDDWYFNFDTQFYSGGNYTSDYNGKEIQERA
jgi:hypothetical protein